MQEFSWMDFLSSGSLQQAGKDAVSFKTAFRASSKAYLAEYHQSTLRLLRMIVCGLYTWMSEEGKEMFLFGTEKISSQRLSGLEA